ncbi:MAG: ABC transporter permease [Candidatus Bipolaricaulia bacterium]
MSKTITVLLFELRSILRRRLFLIMTVAFPILALLLILIVRLVSPGDGEPELHGYVDQWGRLPAELPAEIPLRPFPSQEKAQAALLNDEIEIYFAIPTNYVETGIVQQYRTSETSIFDDEDEGALAILRTLLIQALVIDEVTPEIAARVQQPVLIETVRLTSEGEIAPEERDRFSRFIIPYVFSLLLLMSILFSSGFMVQSVAEEKQSRTIEILLSSVSPATLMAGKILGLGTAGLLQILVWLISALFLVSVAGSILPLPGDMAIDPAMLGLGVVFFVLGYLFFATILASIGAIATSTQEGSQISGFVSLIAVIPLWFVTFIIDEPNGALARVLTLIPFTAPVTVMLRLSATSLPWLDIFGGTVLLAVSSVGTLFLSARIFRTYLLLYGRRPGLRELWRTLRTAG